MSIHNSVGNKKGSELKVSKTPSKQTDFESEKFSKDIVATDFYVLGDDESDAFEFETLPTNTKVSIMEPTKEPKEVKEDFDLKESTSDESGEQEQEIMEKGEEVEDLDKSFFEKVVDEDADKKQIVEEIAGMEVSVEDKDVEGEKEEDTTTEKHSTIQFQYPEEREMEPDAKTESKKSVEDEANIPPIARRPSGIPELMKISRKSLLALTSSSEVTSRKSSAHRKEEGEMPSTHSTVEFYGDHRPSRATAVSSDSKRIARRSTYYGYYGELGPRYRQLADDEDILAGFDIGGDAPILFDEAPEEEEQVITVEEEEQPALDRKPFYLRHDEAVKDIVAKKIKNFILQKKLAMYFKRKKMDYVTKETDGSFDTQNKYYRKLEAYGDLIDFVTLEKVRITSEIEETKAKKMEKLEELTNMFKKLQNREGEIGYGLINTKTGNALPDKFVERLIRRQNVQMTQVSSMRLTYIRLKGMVQEKLDAIANLDEIAPGFLLADYEQLKSDNRAFSDKIEEKDEELNKLRAKCRSTIQVLAHLREKSAALENDLEDLIEDRNAFDLDYFQVRSKLNRLKQDRDNYRHLMNKMKEESGLLTQPALLKDMENGLAEVEELSKQINQLKISHRKRSKEIKTIRKRIETTVEVRRGLSKKSSLDMQKSNVLRTTEKQKSYQIYKGRPSLMMPVIEDSAFNSLKTIKPKLTLDRSQRNKKHIKCSKRKDG